MAHSFIKYQYFEVELVLYTYLAAGVGYRYLTVPKFRYRSQVDLLLFSYTVLAGTAVL